LFRVCEVWTLIRKAAGSLDFAREDSLYLILTRRKPRAFLNSQPSTLNSSKGFTLFEVMIAVFMTVLLTFSLFRFVTANLEALRFSTENAAESEAITGLINLVQGQLNELPVAGTGVADRQGAEVQRSRQRRDAVAHQSWGRCVDHRGAR
jgi:hypothetical protein